MVINNLKLEIKMLHKLHKLNNQKSDFESLNGPKTSKNVKPELLWGYAALLNCDYQQFKTRK
jgi:hypothetical protein